MNIKLVYCENTDGFTRGWLPDDFNPIDDIRVEHLESKEELLDVLLEIAGYDYEEFNTENENMTIDEKIVEALFAFDDISSGSPYMLYIGIDGKPAYEDDIQLQRPDDLQQFNFEGYIDDHELKKAVAEVIYGDDWPSEDSEELDEQGEDDEEYEPQLTTDRMHAGQWYESLDKENDKYSVLREALDILDREDGEAKRAKVKARIKSLRSRLKA